MVCPFTCVASLQTTAVLRRPRMAVLFQVKSALPEVFCRLFRDDTSFTVVVVPAIPGAPYEDRTSAQ
jgi:hypothetical protein